MANELIIGTAGHVDHGKSTLIKALTGIETDRLKEEKERGISIELGFANFILPSGKCAGIVDVPGHERFLHNMLAGTGGMDLVLLVIAADEGVMPQTREHLDILQLLGIRQGIIVLTKCDTVDEDWLAMIEDDVEKFLKGTVLEGAPVCRVSAMSGWGIDELVSKIEQVADLIKPRCLAGSFRLPIDRVFTMQGFGTVVTGTLWSGILQEADAAVIEPGGQIVRIRGLQVYGQKVSVARAGQRTAVNIASVECSELSRGQVLVKANALTPGRMIGARFTLLKHMEKELKNGTRIRFYTGTAEIIGRIYLLEQEKILPGDNGLVQIRLETPVAATYGDRFVLRLYSPLVTIGGGVILEVSEHKYRRYNKKILELLLQKEKGQPEDLVYQVLATAKAMLALSEIRNYLPQFTAEEIRLCLAKLVDQAKVNEWLIENVEYYLDKEIEVGWLDNLQKYLSLYHQQHKLRMGVPREEARQKVMATVTQKQFQLLLGVWQQSGKIAVEGQKIRLLSHEVRYAGIHKQWQEKFEHEFINKLFSPPDINTLIDSSKVKSKEAWEVWESLLERGIIIRIAEGVYFHHHAIQKAMIILKGYFDKHERLTPADFRDLIGSSRKYCMPLLEYFDAIGYTKRYDEYRIQNAKNTDAMVKTKYY